MGTTDLRAWLRGELKRTLKWMGIAVLWTLVIVVMFILVLLQVMFPEMFLAAFFVLAIVLGVGALWVYRRRPPGPPSWV